MKKVKLKPLKIRINKENSISLEIENICDYKYDNEKVEIFLCDKFDPIVIKRDNLYYPHWRGLIEKLNSIFEK